MGIAFIPSRCHRGQASELPSTRNAGRSFYISDFQIEISSCPYAAQMRERQMWHSEDGDSFRLFSALSSVSTEQCLEHRKCSIIFGK